jgi:hypothetical protein
MRMINLIVSVFGALMVMGGFYFMYLGFNIPPNPIAFFLGLIASVFGLILMIFFGSKIDLSRGGTKTPKKAVSPKPVVKATKPIKVPAKDKKPSKPVTASKSKAIKPKSKAKGEVKSGSSASTTPPVTKRKAIKPEKAIKPKKAEGPKKITPQVKPKADSEKPTTLPPDIASKPKVTPKKIAPVKKSGEDKKGEPTIVGKKIEPVKTPEPVKKPIKSGEEKMKPPAPKSVLETADKERLKQLQSRPGRDDQFVKNRLNKLKENYIENAKDIENIIDERLDSFKGTINKMKTDSTEPSIIWSFEAQDVQEAMKDTIAIAENRLLMMYPWVRNIDVGILKKFMDTDSRMILQEASLDDDASVELIKLLLDKNVQIKTMPHVHTVAVVADDSNGLIISTDPIYESYEVGVIYKDKKSILEIERMFEDAWSISKDLDLELRK